MNKELLTHNIEKLLIALHKQIVDIRDADSRVPKIEMDQALANVRALYEQFTVLNYLNTYGESRDKSQAAPAGNPASLQKTESKPEQIKAGVSSALYEQTDMADRITAPGPETSLNPKAAPSVSLPEPEIIPALSGQKNQAKEKVSVTLGEMKELTLADKLRTQKLEDLNKAINMADKFLFINDLFKGKNTAYKEALDILNKLTDGSEAERYMSSLSLQYNWAENPKTEKKFRELVARKFS